jgi:ketosteroid isomerase-like protein
MVQQPSVSVETLKAIADAFNAHDLDAIMEFFADECSLDMPPGLRALGTALYG